MAWDKHTIRLAPRRVRRIIARVCERDKAFFARNPGILAYQQPAVPGEFWPESVPASAPVMVVNYDGSDFRIRQCEDLVVVDFPTEMEWVAQCFLPSPLGLVRTEPSDASDSEDGRP